MPPDAIVPDAAATAAAAAAAAAAAGGTPPGPWYGTPDAETLGYLQARGLDKLTPDKAAFEAIKAHRAAETLIGAPADQLIRMPATNDVEGWNKVHAKLGMPEKAEGYAFNGIKNLDGTELKPEQVTVLQGLAHKLRLDPNRALLMAQELGGIAKLQSDTRAAEQAGSTAAEVAALKTNWGANFAVNEVVAQNVAAKFKVELPKDGAPMVIPYSKALEMFRDVGTKVGEDQFVQGGPDKKGVMTKEQAQFRLTQLESDSIFYKRMTDGDALARQEFDNLTRIIHAG